MALLLHIQDGIWTYAITKYSLKNILNFFASIIIHLKKWYIYILNIILYDILMRVFKRINNYFVCQIFSCSH